MTSLQDPTKPQSLHIGRLTLGSAALTVLAALGLTDTFSSYATVAVGSALGGMARHWCTVVSIAWFGAEFPWGTLFINILGSFVIGFFFAFAGPGERFETSASARLFVMTGLCGGYTTFSAFSLQTLSLLQSEAWLRGTAYVAASVVLCLLAVSAGYVLARAVAVAL